MSAALPTQTELARAHEAGDALADLIAQTSAHFPPWTRLALPLGAWLVGLLLLAAFACSAWLLCPKRGGRRDCEALFDGTRMQALYLPWALVLGLAIALSDYASRAWPAPASRWEAVLLSPIAIFASLALAGHALPLALVLRQRRRALLDALGDAAFGLAWLALPAAVAALWLESWSARALAWLGCAAFALGWLALLPPALRAAGLARALEPGDPARPRAFALPSLRRLPWSDAFGTAIWVPRALLERVSPEELRALIGSERRQRELRAARRTRFEHWIAPALFAAAGLALWSFPGAPLRSMAWLLWMFLLSDWRAKRARRRRELEEWSLRESSAEVQQAYLAVARAERVAPELALERQRPALVDALGARVVELPAELREPLRGPGARAIALAAVLTLAWLPLSWLALEGLRSARRAPEFASTRRANWQLAAGGAPESALASLARVRAAAGDDAQAAELYRLAARWTELAPRPSEGIETPELRRARFTAGRVRAWAAAHELESARAALAELEAQVQQFAAEHPGERAQLAPIAGHAQRMRDELARAEGEAR